MTSTRRAFLTHGFCAGLGVPLSRSLGPMSISLGACATFGREPFHGVDVSSGEHVTLRASEWTEGISLTGRYRSAQLGTLTLEQRTSSLRGSYALAIDGIEITGTLSGELHGNHCEFAWDEAQRIGHSEPRRCRGHGYFLVDLPLAPRERLRLFGARSYLVRRKPRDPRGREELYLDRPAPWTAVALAPRGASEVTP